MQSPLHRLRFAHTCKIAAPRPLRFGYHSYVQADRSHASRGRIHRVRPLRIDKDVRQLKTPEVTNNKSRWV